MLWRGGFSVWVVGGFGVLGLRGSHSRIFFRGFKGHLRVLWLRVSVLLGGPKPADSVPRAGDVKRRFGPVECIGLCTLNPKP